MSTQLDHVENSSDIQVLLPEDLQYITDLEEIVAGRDRLYALGDELDIFLANTEVRGEGEGAYIIDPEAESQITNISETKLCDEYPALRDLYKILIRFINFSALSEKAPDVLFNSEYFQGLGSEIYDYLDLFPWSDLEKYHKIAITKTLLNFLNELKNKPESIVYIDTSIPTSQELIRDALEKGQVTRIGKDRIDIHHNVLVTYDDNGGIEFHRNYYNKGNNIKGSVRLCFSTNEDAVILLIEWSDYTPKQKGAASVIGRSIQIQFSSSELTLLNIEELRYSGKRNKTELTNGIYLEYNPHKLEFEITGINKNEDYEGGENGEDDDSGETENIDIE